MAPSGQYPRYRPGMGMDGGWAPDSKDPSSAPLDSAKYAQPLGDQSPQGIPSDWLPGAGYLQQQAQQPAPAAPPPSASSMSGLGPQPSTTANSQQAAMIPLSPGQPQQPHGASSFASPSVMESMSGPAKQPPQQPQPSSPNASTPRPQGYSMNAGLGGGMGHGMGGQSPWQRQQRQPAMQQKPALQYKTGQSLNSGGGGSWGT